MKLLESKNDAHFRQALYKLINSRTHIACVCCDLGIVAEYTPITVRCFFPPGSSIGGCIWVRIAPNAAFDASVKRKTRSSAFALGNLKAPTHGSNKWVLAISNTSLSFSVGVNLVFSSPNLRSGARYSDSFGLTPRKYEKKAKADIMPFLSDGNSNDLIFSSFSFDKLIDDGDTSKPKTLVLLTIRSALLPFSSNP